MKQIMANRINPLPAEWRSPAFVLSQREDGLHACNQLWCQQVIYVERENRFIRLITADSRHSHLEDLGEKRVEAAKSDTITINVDDWERLQSAPEWQEVELPLSPLCYQRQTRYGLATLIRHLNKNLIERTIPVLGWFWFVIVETQQGLLCSCKPFKGLGGSAESFCHASEWVTELEQSTGRPVSIRFTPRPLFPGQRILIDHQVNVKILEQGSQNPRRVTLWLKQQGNLLAMQPQQGEMRYQVRVEGEKETLWLREHEIASGLFAVTPGPESTLWQTDNREQLHTYLKYDAEEHVPILVPDMQTFKLLELTGYI